MDVLRPKLQLSSQTKVIIFLRDRLSAFFLADQFLDQWQLQHFLRSEKCAGESWGNFPPEATILSSTLV